MDECLDRTFRELWTELSRGAVDRHHGFHVASLATRGLDDAPRARSVVLRHVDADPRVIRCHTDRRSGKIAEIARDARVSWLFYAAECKVQIRVSAHAEIVAEGTIPDEAWARTGLSSRRAYLAPRTPGASCDAPSPNLPAHMLGRRPDEAESETGRAHFAVVSTRAYAIDWLFLASDGHQRARFVRADDGVWSGSWVEP